jgi:hypothetical protein
MIRYNFNEAIDRLERSFITGEIKIATGEVWEDIDLLRRIISERKLPAGHGAANAAALIQGQTERYTSLGGLAPHGRCEGAARFGRAAKLKDRWLVLICLL